MTETQIQNAIFKWSRQPQIRTQYPELALLHHIPNETKDAIERKQKLMSGMKPGVPDLCLPVARGGYHGLYIELKTAKGRPSEEQTWWLLKLGLQGYKAVLCKGYKAAVEEILRYLESEGQTHDNEYALDEDEELPTKEDLCDIGFMGQCFEAGRDKSKLYQHYLDGSCSSADDRALKAEADIIKIVMNWEADDGEVR